jgi:hypothetical protein
LDLWKKNSEIKRQPIGNQRSGKEIQVMEKKCERGCQLPDRAAIGQ